MERKPTLTTIAIDKLHPHPDNPRKVLGDIDELAESIKASGILQNLTVVPMNDDWTEFTVIIGHRRLAAAKSVCTICRRTAMILAFMLKLQKTIK